MGRLGGRKVAVLCTHGVEEVELIVPRRALEHEGAVCVLVAPEPGRVQAFHHLDKGDHFAVDAVLSSVSAADFDALLLPGGVANPDALRQDESAVRFVKDFFSTGKPTAAICHAPWMLVEADVVCDRRLTSWPSLQTDIRNAGGEWVDAPVCRSAGLVTSRGPDDLLAFCAATIELFAAPPPRSTERRDDPSDSVAQASEGSFPASDPPSF